MNTQSPRSLSLTLLASLLALVSCALPPTASSQALRAQAGAYELEVRVGDVPVRSYAHAGETHILGQAGSRYVLRIHNRSARRVEAVVSVDGLDVIDGKTGDFANKRGYLVPAYGYVDIDGWRLSNREAAAFRFSPIAESYAEKTGRGRNVGVIGVAVFPERVVRPKARVYSAPYDYQSEAREESAPSTDLGAGAGAEAKGAAGYRSAPPSAAPAASSSKRGAGAGETASANEARASSSAPRSRPRSGLGTEFGEALSSEIRQVEFVRAHASRPQALLGARYNDRPGLIALGIDVDGHDRPSDLALRQSASPFPVSSRFARPPADWRRD